MAKNRKAIRKKTQIQKNIILYMDKKKLTKKIWPEYKQWIYPLSLIYILPFVLTYFYYWFGRNQCLFFTQTEEDVYTFFRKINWFIIRILSPIYLPKPSKLPTEKHMQIACKIEYLIGNCLLIFSSFCQISRMTGFSCIFIPYLKSNHPVINAHKHNFTRLA